MSRRANALPPRQAERRRRRRREPLRRTRRASGLDLAVETRRLSALLDGLTLQAVQHPDLVGPDELRAVLHRHLDTLAAPRP
ncbi:TetR family transcriptional regulator C-terminal domain-containing protein [Streptomyces sp. SP17BM10]|uniref:TetR family transcriptional regulator C-terminal domain-containing protein n=1 Tax=Streptomyces sp. SP17BM10 TaxID=3002530 RepID=UPI002E792E85|nr:TetR family transcriptional regulator C-terminal domain-containing protein [Streptomyces sp. SP17BM10]MEE1782137.1 TetR family transcriptional regulator C-terminal domain-containing protein [Streptomyces sp. SP17BM10]